MKLYESKLWKERKVDKTPAEKIAGIANFTVVSHTFVSSADACGSQSIVVTLADRKVGGAKICHHLGAVCVGRHLGAARVSRKSTTEIGRNSAQTRTPEAGCSHRAAATKHALDDCAVDIDVSIAVDEREQQKSCVLAFQYRSQYRVLLQCAY